MSRLSAMARDREDIIQADGFSWTVVYPVGRGLVAAGPVGPGVVKVQGAMAARHCNEPARAGVLLHRRSAGPGAALGISQRPYDTTHCIAAT